MWVELGKTEVIMDNLDPKFITSFTIDYHFEERQKLKIEVYDIDDFSANATLAAQDYIGELEFMLHEVVTAKDQTLSRPLINTSKQN